MSVRLLFLSLLSMGLCCSSMYGQVNQKDDFQLWLSDGLHKKLGEKWQAYLLVEHRFGDDASRLYLMFIQLNLTYKFRKWLNIVPGYRQLWRTLPPSNSRFSPVYEPIFAITPHFEKNGWQVFDRNRVDMRNFEQGKPIYLYRNRLRVVTPWKLTKAQIVPYFEDEFFWTEKRRIPQNRIIIGGMIDFPENYKAIVYYLLRHIEIGDQWRRHHILGLRMELSF